MFKNKTIIKIFYVSLGCLILLEISARVWLKYFATLSQRQVYAMYTEIGPNDYQWSPHHYLNYYPTPNYREGLTSHNSLGYRGKEISVKKPKGVYRIAVLGGSSVYEVAIHDNKKTFTVQLEDVLKDTYGYRDVEVINAGAGGYNSWESLIDLEFRIMDLEPDLVIVYHNVNDVHARLVSPSAYRGDNSGRRKQWQYPPVSFWEHSCFLRCFLRKLGLSHQVWLETVVCAPTAFGYPPWKQPESFFLEALKKNPPVYFQRNLRNMIAIAKENEINIMLSTWASSPYFDDYIPMLVYQKGLAENNEVIIQVARSHDIPLFDLAAVMPKDKEYWADGRHVNEKGARKKAELFAGFIHKNGLIPR